MNNPIASTSFPKDMAISFSTISHSSIFLLNSASLSVTHFAAISELFSTSLLMETSIWYMTYFEANKSGLSISPAFFVMLLKFVGKETDSNGTFLLSITLLIIASLNITE